MFARSVDVPNMRTISSRLLGEISPRCLIFKIKDLQQYHADSADIQSYIRNLKILEWIYWIF